MNNKSKKLDGKKLTTAQAIAQTRKKKKVKLSKSLEKTAEIGNIINNVNSLEHKASLKTVITTKEYSFLSNYLSGGVTVIEAMNQAGYIGYNESYLYRLGKKIVEKYESQADDHRIILRAMGAGEVEVINGLLSLARGAKGEMVRLNAWSQLSKILGLTKEQLEGAGGVTIIFEGPGSTASLPGAPPLPPSQGEIKVVPASTKPIMITK